MRIRDFQVPLQSFYSPLRNCASQKYGVLPSSATVLQRHRQIQLKQVLIQPISLLCALKQSKQVTRILLYIDQHFYLCTKHSVNLEEYVSIKRYTALMIFSGTNLDRFIDMFFQGISCLSTKSYNVLHATFIWKNGNCYHQSQSWVQLTGRLNLSKIKQKCLFMQ